jgi:hypothetical protein
MLTDKDLVSNYNQALRSKLRFASNAGTLSLERLWELPLESTRGASLDDVGRRLLAEKKSFGEESMVRTSGSAAETTNNLSINIVQYVIDTKKAEETTRQNQAAAGMKLRRLNEARARAQDRDLDGKTVAEIDAAIAAVQAQAQG